ncbi:MAG: hypothetical protein M3Q58_01205 [Bacteroidota bacterium]|nr:hypothetical protein [Bacteroidota bacterium]
MTREAFITKNAHLFWYIKKEAIPNISNEVLVEFIFNYGTLDDVKELIKIIGFQELKRVYEDVTDRGIGNYIPEMLDLLSRITNKYAS